MADGWPPYPLQPDNHNYFTHTDSPYPAAAYPQSAWPNSLPYPDQPADVNNRLPDYQAAGHHVAPYPPYPVAGAAAPDIPVPVSSMPIYTINEPQPDQVADLEAKNGLFTKSGLINKGLSLGMQMVNDAMKSGRRPSAGAGSDEVDGNVCGGYSSVQSPYSASAKGAASPTSSMSKFANQDFVSLRQRCLSKRTLFEDPEFPAQNRLLVDDKQQFIISYFGRQTYDAKSIEWLRPHEICQKLNLAVRPKMFVGKTDRFDINQGEIGNCWFLAALANLVENKTCFDRVVPAGQDFDSQYAGIFRFRFWRFGEWVEVVIDDRLPTRRGELIYLRSIDKNEFWGALLEKAYAKLNGSYKSLEGGLTIEAAVDFTGGIPELIDLSSSKLSPEQIFYLMSKADARGAFMGCALGNSSRVHEATQKGLQSRHAYTITKVVEIRSSKVRNGIPLIRLRNPHGNSKEWRGDWSDDDRNWKLIPTQMRQELGLTFEDDGEFYMSFRDFIKYFAELEICHLSPNSVHAEDSHKKFEVFSFRGRWIAGSSAGGCGNQGFRYFAMNPQFFLTLSDPDPYDHQNLCPLVVSLLQRQDQRKSEHAIGFKVYRCDPSARSLDERFFNHNPAIEKNDGFINLREVSKRLQLPEGRYCIVPCTYQRGEEGDFLLRVFVEKRWGSSELSSGKGVDVVDEPAGPGRIQPTPIGPSLPTIPDNNGGKHDKAMSDLIHGFKKNKITGFALKKLQQQFPGGLKKLNDIYSWTKDRESEFAILKAIVQSLQH